MRIFALLVLVGCGRLGFEARVGESEPPAGSIRTSHPATIAECLDPAAPNLTSCTMQNGGDQLVVDGEDGETKSPWESFLRFDLGDAFAGRTIVGVTLVLTATDDDKAHGPDSGAIWEVEPFDQTSLATAAPAQLRAAPLAESRGAVDAREVVRWELPATIASETVYLGVITGDPDSGVNYWNLDGAEPPRLDIDVR